MKQTSQEQLGHLLEALGVVAGDCLVVHAFVPSLGVVEGGLDGVIAAIKRRLGESGTIVVPTFTSSYRRGEIYDVRESKSFNGAISEHVRRLPGAVRSLCPLFSMAALGPEAEALMHRPTAACFGPGSVYENLFVRNAKFMSLGVHWDQGLSFFMHLERLAGIPSRRDELFVGTTRLIDGRLTQDRAIHFVRIEAPPWRRDRGRLGRSLVARGVVREVIEDGCAHRLFESASLAEATLAALTRDPWCMTDRAIDAVPA